MGKKRVVIVGGGFGGMYCAKELCSLFKKDREWEVVLINRNNYFLFTPLLHEVATANLSGKSVTLPIRESIDDDNFTFLKGEATMIDPRERSVIVKMERKEAKVVYDYLVIAAGSTNNFFGIEGAEKHAFPLKSIEDAYRVRNHMIDMFELSEAEDEEERRKNLRFVVVGGGPTGVETVAEVRNMINKSVSGLYKNGAKDVEIILVHSSSRLLDGFDSKLDGISRRRLEKIGVKVMVDSRVTKVTPNGIQVNRDETIDAGTVIWAAGVRPNYVESSPEIKRDDKGRIVVNEALQAEGHPEIFAIGDNSAVRSGALPATGQVAWQQAKHTARNIRNAALGEEPRPFEYKHGGNLISIGAGYAAGDINNRVLYGNWVWFLWRTIYLSKIVGGRSKSRIALEWLIELIFKRDTSQI